MQAVEIVLAAQQGRVATKLFGVENRDGSEQVVEELSAQLAALRSVFWQRLVDELSLEEVLFAGDGRDGGGLVGER